MTPGSRCNGERGATLIIVLILMTVFAMVVGVVLSQVDTSVRATQELRDQAAYEYTADGAGQTALNTLRTNTFDGADTKCFGTKVLELAGTASQPFYTSPNGEKLAAAVDCNPDPTSGKAGVETTLAPGTALLATGTAPLSPDDIEVNGAGAPFNVGGKIYANSHIEIDNKDFNNVSAQGSFTAAGGPSGCTVDSKGDTTIKGSHVNCIAANGDGMAAFSGYMPTIDQSAQPQTVSCNNTLAPNSATVRYTTLSPGVYTDAKPLTNCVTKLMWFQPGVYYFNFDGAAPLWTMKSPVVAGTLAHPISGPNDPLLSLGNSSVQGQCDNPLARQKNKQNPLPGAEFVFGGASSFTPDNTFFEICGLFDSGRHIISIYGLTSPITVGSGSGSTTIPAQQTPTTQLNSQCGGKAFIYTTYGNSFNMFVLGTMYAPRACLDMEYQNGGVEVFHFGLVAWQFYFNVNGSSSSTPFVNVDDVTTSTPPGPVYALLKVYVYPQGQTSPCTASSCSGTPSLIIKVKIPQSDNSGNRTIGVLSWTRQN